MPLQPHIPPPRHGVAAYEWPMGQTPPPRCQRVKATTDMSSTPTRNRDLMLGTPWGPQLKDRIGDIICCRVVHIVAKEPTILFQFPIRHNFSLPPSQAPTGAATFAARGGTRMAAGSPLAAARVGGPGKVIGIASTERFRKPTVSSFTLEENEANFNPLGQPKTMCVTN